jgi:hypothetical protein
MSANVVFEDGDYGLRAVVKSAWSDSVDRRLRLMPIAELELNDAKGWQGKDLSFLVNFPNLLAFKIIDLSISSVQPIHALGKLRSLDVITYCTTELHFDMFPALEKCAIEWRPKATSLFGCKKLRSLYVNRYNGKNVDSFTQLTNLECLAILNSPIQNLFGLHVMKKLKSLRLANLNKLTSLKGIEELLELGELEIQRCRCIGSIDPVACLSKLRFLDFNDDGDIASLSPLENLKLLERVTFYESTNILDGDISPLKSLRRLSRVSFQNRRHYSHKREEFGESYTG